MDLPVDAPMASVIANSAAALNYIISRFRESFCRISNYDGLGSATAPEIFEPNHLVSVKSRKRNLPAHPDNDPDHE
jgi:hypothetical protein